MGERFLRTSATAQVKKEVLRVKRIKVEGLFGLYNHDIPLNSEERVTILHGPNGVGKTVLLKMIAAVFGGNYRHLNKTRFTKFAIDFSNETSLAFEFLISPELDDKTLRVALTADERTLQYKDFSDPDNIVKAENYRPGRAASIRRYRSSISRNKDSTLPLPIPLNALTEEEPLNVEPSWLAKIRNCVQVHLIETERLLRTDMIDPEDGSPMLVHTVREIASDLQMRIAEALSNYAIESQSIEQSFPQRLLKTRRNTRIDLDDLRTRITELNDERERLEKLGLRAPTATSPFELDGADVSDPVQSNVISLFIEDARKKLSVLDDIARRITLLLDYINGKFRNKSIEISREEGFVVLGHDKTPIDANSLSSGEQHELVQLYDLLFRVKPGTLVLIDEPELSLHVLWQKKYLSELLEIAKTAEFDAIVATHSPFIVGDRSDLMVPLDADIDT